MAAGPWIMYRDAKRRVINQTTNPISIGNDLFRLLLLTASYTPSLLHVVWSDVSPNEVANGNGYATHGVAIDLTVTVNANGSVTIGGNSAAWPAASFTTKYGIIAHDADADGAIGPAAQVICYCDLNVGGGAITPANQTFTITPSASGLIVTN